MNAIIGLGLMLAFCGLSMSEWKGGLWKEFGLNMVWQIAAVMALIAAYALLNSCNMMIGRQP